MRPPITDLFSITVAIFALLSYRASLKRFTTKTRRHQEEGFTRRRGDGEEQGRCRTPCSRRRVFENENAAASSILLTASPPPCSIFLVPSCLGGEPWRPRGRRR